MRINSVITIKTALEEGKKYLETHNSDFSIPSLESQILLSFVIEKQKEYIIAHPEHKISLINFNKYKSLLKLRGKKKPISQIINNKEFYSRNFIINESTLTPRPETETLIEQTLRLLPDLNQEKKELFIADIGTGSGCIAITIALESARLLDIKAYDVSKKAITLAKKNWQAFTNLTKSSITFKTINIEDENPKAIFDLILSNPPYIPYKDESLVANDVIKWEPKEALFADDNGLAVYKSIKIFCDKYLDKQYGKGVFELYPPNSKTISSIFANEYNYKIIKDYSGKDRVIIISPQ